MDDWRTFLYPLGFIPSVVFGARFLLQWLQSEKAHKSLVPRSFWQLSLLGNIMLLVHSFIQMQVHVCIVQALNGVVAWRNLNLMSERKSQVSFHTVLSILFTSVLVIILAFVAQGKFFNLEGSWFRVPIAPWQSSESLSITFFWHALGTLGYLLFSSRFWIQWWLAERCHASILPLSFWWLSLTGALLSIAYFIRISDSVNLIGPLLGIVPYIRNLMLMYNAKEAA